MNTAYIISCALAGTLSLLLGIFVYLKNRTSNVNKIAMFLNFGVSLWSWGIFGRELSFEKTTALFFVRLSYCGAIFIPPLFFHFVSSLLKQVKNTLILFVYGLSLIFLIFRFHTFIHQRCRANTFIPLLRYSWKSLSFLCCFVYQYYRLQPLHLD